MTAGGCHRVRLLLTLLVLTIGASLVGAPSAFAAHASCGDVVIADLTLENDVTGCAGDGLTVEADGVTLDLNGHTVSGIGTGTGVAIGSTQAVIDVSIVDGVVRGFATGIHVFGGRSTLSRLSVRGNTTRGIRLDAGSSVQVVRNEVAGNAGDGILAGIPGNNVIRENILARNAGNGLSGLEDSVQRVEGNIATRNGRDGIFLQDSVASVIGNIASDNGSIGVEISERIPSFIPQYVVAHNVANKNGIGGIRVVDTTTCCPPNLDPPDPPAGTGNIARHNGEFDCQFAVILGTEVLWTSPDWGCVSNRGRAAKLARAGALLRHS